MLHKRRKVDGAASATTTPTVAQTSQHQHSSNRISITKSSQAQQAVVAVNRNITSALKAQLTSLTQTQSALQQYLADKTHMLRVLVSHVCNYVADNSIGRQSQNQQRLAHILAQQSNSNGSMSKYLSMIRNSSNSSNSGVGTQQAGRSELLLTLSKQLLTPAFPHHASQASHHNGQAHAAATSTSTSLPLPVSVSVSVPACEVEVQEVLFTQVCTAIDVVSFIVLVRLRNRSRSVIV